MLSRKFVFVSTTALALSASAQVHAQVAEPQQTRTLAQSGAHAKNGLEEVVVTARRRAERAQTTPVSVTVLSTSTLKQRNVQEIQDLNNVVPGFRFGSEGGKSTNDAILRGLSRIPLGAGVPAVVSYFNDVPLPGLGSNLPFYDISNVQVLKGPQGTLFGRNTLGGAILITPTQPTDKYGGYIDGQLGNYGHEDFSGAVNLPFVPDKVELRIAGQVRRESGYVKSINQSGATFGNTDENSYRISLLLRPTSTIQNITTYDYLTAPEEAAGEYLLNGNPGVIPGLSGLIDSQIRNFVARQHAAGPFYAFSDSAGSGKAFRRLQGLSNDTRVDLTDDIQVRNILGYRKAFNDQLINTGAVPDFGVTIPGLGAVPFKLYDAAEVDNQEYLTDEVQVIGHSLNRRLNWIIGGFYNHDDPTGPAGTNFNAFAIGPSKGTYTTSQVENHNYALYGQAGLDLSDWVLKGLTFNAGYRYSWDMVHGCGGMIGTNYASQNTCEEQARLHIPGGAGDVGAEGSEPSWTFGFDYKYSERQFFYVTTRRGYRGVNINTPLFSSPYTTGGVVVPPFIGGPGCTGPGNRCPDLRQFQTTGPEKLTDVEVGSKTDFSIGGMQGRLDIAAFWEKYSKAVQFFNVAQTGIYLSAPDLPTAQSVGINAADETIDGVEVGFILKPIPDLTLSLDGAYNNAEIDSVTSPSTTGLQLTKGQITLPSPRFSGSASVTYTAPVHPLQGNLLFVADWYQTGKFGGQYGVNLPGYGIGNARLALNNIANSGFDVALYVRNILDRAYLISPTVLLNSFPTNSAIYAEPRTYGIEARYTF